MRSKLSWIMLVVLIFSLITIQGVYVGNAPTLPKVFVTPPVVKDATLEPNAPNQTSYPSNHFTDATVADPANAYDRNQSTAASINLTANPYPGYSFFDVTTFNSTFIQPYAAIEINVNYNVTSISSSLFRILLYVGSASTILQDWTSSNRRPRTWTGIPEPNDGDWSQADVSNMRISVETKKTAQAGKGTFKIYETWVSILGDSFKVNINVSNVSDIESLFGWQINMTFNPAVVNTTSIYSIWEGPFLRQVKGTLFLRSTDNVAGYVFISCSLEAPYPQQGAFGSGTLVHITFKVRAPETKTLLQFAEGTKLNTVIGEQLVPIEHTTKDGVFDNRIGNHDVAVTNVKSHYVAAMRGVQVPVNVTVANKGDFTETLNVTAYFNETTIETQKVIDMPPHTEKSLTFTWNTTGLDFGKYVLKANATVVEGDYYSTNNEYIDGTVAIALTNIADYPVVVGGFIFHVVVESNSTPSSILQFNEAEKKIGFNVTGETDTTGFCNVTIPVDLLGGLYTVLFDDLPIIPEPQETTNGTHTFLYFTYIHSLHTIQIIGQTVATPPIAIFTSSTTRAIAHTSVTFNATDSYARTPYGTIESYQWDFGDGNTTTWLTNPVIIHAYKTAGTYIVTLTVKDNKKLTDSTQIQITVIDYPTADFSYLPATPLEGETVTFNASASEPNGGSIIIYQWDFGDGSTDHDITVTHMYPNVGNYVVVLNVTDDEGLWDAETKTVTVSIHNIAVTDLTAAPNSVKIGQQISISIRVANKGNFTETFDVTAYYNNTPVETKSVTSLAPGASKTMFIAWNTTGVNPGTYKLKAIATTVNGETEKDDNTFMGSTVTINTMDSQPTPINFLYIVAATVIIISVATAFYFLKIRKLKITQHQERSIQSKVDKQPLTQT